MKLAPWQMAAIYSPYEHFAMLCGISCVRGTTKVQTENGEINIRDLQEGMKVLTLGGSGLLYSKCLKPFVKGKTRLFRVVHSKGELICHGRHLILCQDGNYRRLEDLSEGDVLFSFSENPLHSTQEFHPEFLLNASRSCQKFSGSMGDYPTYTHLYGQQLPGVQELSPERPLVCIGGPDKNLTFLKADGQDNELKDNRRDQSSCLQPNNNALFLSGLPLFDEEGQTVSSLSEPALEDNQSLRQCYKRNEHHHISNESNHNHIFSCSSTYTTIIKIESLIEEEEFWDVEIPETGNYVAEGLVHHNTGKTFTGAHFAIKMIMDRPDLTGFIGANTYDQLSQATLKELFYWLTHYGIQYVIDKRPPKEWGDKLQLKDWHNVLTVWTFKGCTHVFTRVLSKGDVLRGIEFSWYWIDESRDTPLNTHDIILSRMREDKSFRRGLVTTTTAGEDWVYERFVKGNKKGNMYGSLHCPTKLSMDYGIISPDFYNALRASYSEMMAAQELDALHVNSLTGRAYYSQGTHNKMVVSPWGEHFPNPNRPLVIGCDFNFQPAPCIWMIGQVGPEIYNKDGELWSEHIHWYDEICEVQTSSPMMAEFLVQRYPDFFYEIYGDASGNRGTTSNAGETDYIQIANKLDELGQVYSLDIDQANPFVKNRVETMNTLFKNANGHVRMTYNPYKCVNFDSDCNVVGWKKLTGMNGTGKLDDGGDNRRTHATDGGGYAVYKKFPVGRRAIVLDSIPSSVRSQIGINL